MQTSYDRKTPSSSKQSTRVLKPSPNGESSARSIKDEIFGYVVEPRNFIIVLALVNLLFATTVILWITHSMNKRLIRIVRHMKKVKHQNFDTIKQADSMDEIGQLTREFNRMTLRIRSLINDVYVRDLQKKELALQKRNAQLNALAKSD